jgi:hypothetical protein
MANLYVVKRHYVRDLQHKKLAFSYLAAVKNYMLQLQEFEFGKAFEQNQRKN